LEAVLMFDSIWTWVIAALAAMSVLFGVDFSSFAPFGG
jgi:hypothetical protein